MTVRFLFEGAVMEIGLSDPELAQDVARLFPGAQIVNRSGTSSAHDQDSGSASGRLEVGKRSERFYVESEGIITTFDSLPDLMAEVEFSITTSLLGQHSGFTHIHAAGAWTPQGAVLVSGPAGAGKSSCALAWSLAGLPLFGDDVIRVGSDGLVGPFPRLVKVRPDRLAEFGLDAVDTLFWDPEYGEAWFEPEEAAGWMDQKGKAAVVAQIEYDGGDDVRLVEGDKADGLRILLDAVQIAGLPGEKSLDGFIELLKGTRVLRIKYGSSREVAGLLAEMAAEGVSPLLDGR